MEPDLVITLHRNAVRPVIDPRGTDLILIGVDVGGTFTDFVVTNTESRETGVHKVPTTPHDPSQGVITGLKEACEHFDISVGDVHHILHGTTIATNVVLEYDVLELA